MISSEHVILVDERDHPLGLKEKIEAHREGLLHRAFSVFLFRMNGKKLELLLQQREKEKYHCGGLWTNTCCSHPREGETVIQAAERRVHEELGLKTSLRSIGSFVYKAVFSNGLTEHEFDHVVVGRSDVEAPKFDPKEVEATRWITLDVLQQEMERHPDRFTPWFPLALKIVRENLHAIEKLFS